MVHNSLNREIAQQLIEALQWYVENDDTNTGDFSMPEHGGHTWDEINVFWIDGKHRAIAALKAAGVNIGKYSDED